MHTHGNGHHWQHNTDGVCRLRWIAWWVTFVIQNEKENGLNMTVCCQSRKDVLSQTVTSVNSKLSNKLSLVGVNPIAFKLCTEINTSPTL